MATTDFDFSSTRNEIIQRAFRIVGVLSLGDSLSGDQFAQGNQVLNDMVKSWQNRHLFLWRLEPLTLALTASTQSYALPTDPYVVAIDKAYLRISNTDDKVEIISFRDYVDIPTKSDAGDPLVVAINLKESPTLYVWPVPTASRTLYYTGVCKLQDFDLAAGTGDFPVRFKNALVYGLADQLADEVGLPLSEKKMLRDRAEQFFHEAKGSDRERADRSFIRSAY
jgi:hypothetical protein